MNNPNALAGLPAQYRALLGKPELNHQVYAMLPVPIQMFAPDGTSIFANRAFLEMVNIPEASYLANHYNLKHDPVCLEILGQELMDRIFRGEACSFAGFPAPIQDVANRGVIEEKPFEAATMDLFALPVWDGGTFVCTITFFTVRNLYKGRADIARAKDYIRAHWLEKFDLEAAAAAAGMGSRHMRRVFKEVTGSTPFEFYQAVKLEKIEDTLLDESLSVEEVFTACGADFRGAYFRLFKEKTGMTPTEYRKKR